MTATASMKHTNAAEMSIAPSQTEANSTLTLAPAESARVSGSYSSCREEDSSGGAAASRIATAATTATLGCAAPDACFTRATVPATGGAVRGPSVSAEGG